MTTETLAELPAIAEQPTGLSVFTNAPAFEHAQRVAKMLAASALVPDTYRNNLANCMIALEMAGRIGASPLMVMQNLYIVHGKPAWSSQFLIATLNASNRFSPLRYEDGEQDGGATRAYATDKQTGELCYGAWVSMEMAKAEKWIDKPGSKWKTMPELMRRYRAAAFFTRQFAPEVSMGIMTTEEVIDITPQHVTRTQGTKQAIQEALTPELSEADHQESLRIIGELTTAASEGKDAFKAKWQELGIHERRLVPPSEYERLKEVAQ